MTQIVQVYIEQTAKEILYQLETNLRDASEVRRAQNVAQQWKERLADRGFSSLIAIVNREMNHLLSEELTSEDFRGAEVYPSPEKMTEYELKHGLPALSFGVAIPGERWSTIQQKFKMRETSQGLSLSEYSFSESSLGLDAIGLTMHRADAQDGYQEFQQLYEDQAAYSRSFKDLAALRIGKVKSLWELSMALLCRTKRDLCAGRYEKTKEERAHNLAISLDVYGQAYQNELRSHSDAAATLNAFQTLYTAVVAEIIPDISSAIEAVYALEERVGAGIVTPLLFALGTTESHGNRTHFRSPLKGIIKAREYIESGELRTEDITQILEKKGYHQLVFS